MAIGVALGPGIGSALGGGGVSLYQRLLNEVASAALYDPSDLTSLYQSRTGGSTGAADAVVGIMLDKAQMGGASAASFIAGQTELVTNGNFATDSGWTKEAGWTIAGGVAIATGAISTNLYQNAGLVANTWYVATMQVVSRTAGVVGLSIGGATVGFFVSAPGTYTWVGLRGGNADIAVKTSGFSGTVTNVSVKAIPGYHALAPSDAARPILRQANGLSYLETDGVDDWMQVFPTLNLGETWWHVGGWRADTDSTSNFGLSSATQMGVLVAGTKTLYQVRNAADSGYVSLTPSATLSNPHVLTIEQSNVTTIAGRVNANGTTAVTPYDDSGATQGLALFNRRNTTYSLGLAGRFYGGLWKPAAFTSSQRAIAEQWAALKAGVSLA